jgi:hypothetical protein
MMKRTILATVFSPAVGYLLFEKRALKSSVHIRASCDMHGHARHKWIDAAPNQDSP